ncbi:MAG: M20/M25/M40 family metallo-hydrolase, partial [Chloroflexi bacterium]|nr:M20/M25/M40 family metallo-hydrolase [Chloroflexota bacterium]
ELIDVAFGSAENFAERKGQVAGKHALMTAADPPGYGRGIHRKEKYALATAAGAKGFVYASTSVGSLPFTGSLAFGEAGTIPGVSVSGEVAGALRRWLAAGPVRLQVIVRGGGPFPAVSHNVVGDLPGGAKVGPQIILGGHLDTHDIAPGADDNGSGVVCALEAARALLAAGAVPPVRVRVVLFTAEELGLLGAEAYARDHDAELDDVRIVLNADCVGVGGGMGICTQQWPELTAALRAHMLEVDDTANVNDGIVPFSDHFPFALKGVPAVMVSGGPGESGRGFGHTACDTVDKVSSVRLQGTSLNLARLALRIGSDPAWSITRRTPQAVRDVLVRSGHDVALRMDGRWPFAD